MVVLAVLVAIEGLDHGCGSGNKDGRSQDHSLGHVLDQSHGPELLSSRYQFPF